jgi:two-component system, NtrC family, sensor kinase
MPSLHTSRTRSISRRAQTLLSTAFGLCVVLAFGLWDIHHEDQVALRQLTEEHHRLAQTISRQISLIGRGEPLDAIAWIDAEAVHATPAPGPNAPRNSHNENVVVLLSDAANGKYLTHRDHWQTIPELASAQARGENGAILSRNSASLLGLPPRTAVAGLAILHQAAGRFNAVAVVTSAEAERDRSRREQWRSALGIALASLLVLSAGVAVLRTQKRELESERHRALHQMERAQEAELARANRMATIAVLSSGIAHEISTPLGVIAGRIEQLLTLVQGQERAMRALDTIASQVSRIDTVMRGFLAFARGDAPLLVQSSANEIAVTIVRLVEYRFTAAGVALDFIPCAAAPLLFACDPALFEQALIDILVNALEASKENQHVQFLVEHDADYVYFRVRDEGIGISESVIARVTDPFFTTKSGTGGSGLGLAIAKEIIAHHRGSLAFELRRSTKDRTQTGTEVTVQIPRTKEIPLESTT